MGKIIIHLRFRATGVMKGRPAHLETVAFAMNLTATVDAEVAEINLRGPKDR